MKYRGFYFIGMKHTSNKTFFSSLSLSEEYSKASPSCFNAPNKISSFSLNLSKLNSKY